MNEIPKLAEATIVYSPSVKPSEMPKIERSNDVAALVLPSWEQLYEVESVKMLLMNKANKVLGMKVIATGGQDSCLVDQRVILRSALLSVACAIILIHNHPSGNNTGRYCRMRKSE